MRSVNLEHWLKRVTEGSRVVVELGCGNGDKLISVDNRVTWRIGIEILPPPNVFPGIRLIKGDMLDFDDLLEGILSKDEWDTALIVDSIEHVTKDEGIWLLGALQERFKKIAAMIPQGVHPQPPAPDNPYQEHLATWDVEDLESLGFDVVVDPEFHNVEGKSRGCMFGVWERRS